MPSHRVTVTTAPTVLCDVNPKRKVLFILYVLNNGTAANIVGIADGPVYAKDTVHLLVPPVGMDYSYVALKAVDGWDVTKAWYAQCDNATAWVTVNEQVS